jgi:hypothetical protein
MFGQTVIIHRPGVVASMVIAEVIVNTNNAGKKYFFLSLQGRILAEMLGVCGKYFRGKARCSCLAHVHPVMLGSECSPLKSPQLTLIREV